MHAGPELVHIQPLIGPHASARVNRKNTVVNKIPSATGIRVGGGGSSGGSGSSEPLVIHNHLHMNEREIASIVTKNTANIGNRREKLFR